MHYKSQVWLVSVLQFSTTSRPQSQNPPSTITPGWICCSSQKTNWWQPFLLASHTVWLWLISKVISLFWAEHRNTWTRVTDKHTHTHTDMRIRLDHWSWPVALAALYDIYILSFFLTWSIFYQPYPHLGFSHLVNNISPASFCFSARYKFEVLYWFTVFTQHWADFNISLQSFTLKTELIQFD